MAGVRLIGIRGEAGVGKSRLMAELLRLAGERHFTVVGSECQSYGVNSNYLVWQSIWHALLRSTPTGMPIARFRPYVADSLPSTLDWRFAIRCSASLFNIEMPDNELTAALDAKTRKSALESLLIDCLAAEARRRPLAILLEDCHWLDPLSQDLIDAVARPLSICRLCW